LAEKSKSWRKIELRKIELEEMKEEFPNQVCS